MAADARSGWDFHISRSRGHSASVRSGAFRLKLGRSAVEPCSSFERETSLRETES